MKKTFILLFSLAGFQLTFAQQGPPPGFSPKGNQPQIGYGKISGTIQDEQNNPVPFATIALVDDKTGKTKDGTIADESGKFILRSIPEGHFIVNISFIGYEPVQQGPYIITGKGESYVLDAVKLTATTKELEEVVVEGERELFEEKVDRIVYNAEQDKTSAGGDATDVLRRVPLLSVDLDGNVSLRGSSNIRVLIDNRPSTISANSIADALKQIPADQIKSVEVITSPSARYDAEGTGGIINIITKKNNLQGASLNVNSSAGMRGSNLGLNASYRKGRSGFTLGGFGRAGYNINGEFENEQVTKDLGGNRLSVTNQHADTRNNMLFGRYNLGWDYEINKYNWIAASVKFGVFNFSSNQNDRITETYENNALTFQNLQDVGMDNLSNTVDANLNYIKTFEKKGRELSFLTLYSQNSRVNDFEIESLNITTEEIIGRQRNDNRSYNKEYTLQADYVEPLNTNSILEFGGKNITRIVTSDYQFFISEGSEPYTPVVDRGLTNIFDYRQNVSAGYLSYTTEFLEGYSAKVGGRYEYTTIQANFEGESDLNLPSYGVFVPNINLSKKLNMSNTLKVAYSRRIQRPSLQFLNPNLNTANPKNITQGNPNLDPEFTDNYELSYSTFKDGSSVNVSAFMRNTNGSIQQVREILGQDTVFSTYQNIGNEDAYGLSLFANVRIGEKLMLNGGVDSYYAVLDNNATDPLYNASNSGFVISGRLFGSYKITDQWAFQFFGFARGKQVQLQGYQTGFYMYSLNLNRSFADDRGRIGIGAENFLTGEMKMTNEINSPFIDQYNTNVMRNMNFKINFSYRIGKMSMTQPRRRQRAVDNNDLKEGGGNQGMNVNQ